MNRADRRKYIRDHKKDPNASYCARCKGNTRRIAMPSADEKYRCHIVCECCFTVVAKNVQAIPYTYVSMEDEA